MKKPTSLRALPTLSLTTLLIATPLIAQEEIPPLPETETELPLPTIPPLPSSEDVEIPAPEEITPQVVVASKGEIAIKLSPLEIKFQLPASLLPSESQAVQNSPKTSTPFPILSVLPHGTRIEKDQILITFDTRSIDKKILATVKQQEIQKLDLETKRLDLKTLEETTPRQLEAAKRIFDNATQDHDYLLKTELPQLKEKAAQSLKRAEFVLEYTQEELTQLQKMYDADDLTEETEEIILTRLKRQVEKATFELKLAKTTFAKTTQVELPRQEIDSTEKLKTATTNWNYAQITIPRALEKQRLKLTEAERHAELAAQNLADLQADRTLMDIKAPNAGTLYHGEIKDGIWNLSKTPKFLFPGGTLPKDSTFLTIIPDAPTMQLHLRLEQIKHHQTLSAQDPLQAFVTFPNGSTLPLTKDLHQLTPGLDGKYHLSFTVSDNMPLMDFATGAQLPVTITTHQSDQAILIPTASIIRKADGTAYVKLKLADGNPQEQAVTTGLQQGDQTQITTGLQVGQVIIK